jgi:hypothetical protein
LERRAFQPGQVAAVIGLGLHWQRARCLSGPHLGDNGALKIKIGVRLAQRGGACGGQVQQLTGQRFCRVGRGGRLRSGGLGTAAPCPPGAPPGE